MDSRTSLSLRKATSVHLHAPSILDNSWYPSQRFSWDKLFICLLVSRSPLPLNTHTLTSDANRLSERNIQEYEMKTFIVPNHLNYLVDTNIWQHFNHIVDCTQGFVECVLMDDQCFEYVLDHASICFVYQNSSWTPCEALQDYWTPQVFLWCTDWW